VDNAGAFVDETLAGPVRSAGHGRLALGPADHADVEVV
jgi:hypothetical protein